MSSKSEEAIFINRPILKKYDFPYKAPPEPANPVIRGITLHYLAQLIASTGFLQHILWSNAGFAQLRDRPELNDIDPRYEPLVIRTTGQPARSNSPTPYLSSLASEDWLAKSSLKNGPFSSSLDYHSAYKTGRLTPSQVISALLPHINPILSTRSHHSTAFLSVQATSLLEAAERSTQRYRAGQPLSPLDGVPVAVKDEADLANHPKTLGSRLDFTPSDATATSHCVQLWLDAGALVVGKTLMHELGMDTTSCNPFFGTPRNPYHPGFYCGGSSGGSAYAVAAGLLPFTMGNDGGGSVRIPAAYCGIFGLKPSHGRVSIRPSSNLAKSTGVPGPLAANMVDLELAYRVMAQPDAQEPESAWFVPPVSVNEGREAKRKIVLGIFRPWFDRADALVQKTCWAALDWLCAEKGYEMRDITIPLVNEGQIAHAITIMSEIASGIASVSELSPPNKLLLSIAKNHSNVDFLQAQKLRNLLMQHLASLFSPSPPTAGTNTSAEHEILLIVTPTTPNAGWPLDERDLAYGCSNANMSLRNMTYAWMANFTGCPALTAPVGYISPTEAISQQKKGEREGAVPIGLMAMAEWCGEDDLIEFGYDVEAWLREGLPGGRRGPVVWEDIMEQAGKTGTSNAR